MRVSRIVPMLAVALALAACLDPVHADAVSALGGEAPGVRRGPLHRPGQPCLTCHGDEGPATPQMSVAGTVFDVRDSKNALSGVDVTVTDATGVARTLTSNGAGNFYVFKQEWDPVFPLHVALSSGSVDKAMTTRIGRDGSCATCHGGADTNTEMPGVFLKDTP